MDESLNVIEAKVANRAIRAIIPHYSDSGNKLSGMNDSKEKRED